VGYHFCVLPNVFLHSPPPFSFYSAMGDFHELKLGFRRVWAPVETQQQNSYSGNLPGGSNSRVRPYVPVGGPLRSPGVSHSPGGAAASPQRVSAYSTYTTPSIGGGGVSGVVGGAGEEVEEGPGVRFCHVGVVYDGAFYIFGGYDGTQR